MEHTIGLVKSIENKPGRSGTFPLVSIQTEEGEHKYAFFANSARENIFDALNKKIEFSFEKTYNGKWENRILQKGWSFIPDSMPVAAGINKPPQPASLAMTNDRQESIERQSAMNQAVNLAGTALANGYDLVPEGNKKTKVAKKDPELLFEWVRQLAIRIKDQVQKGDWTNHWEVQMEKEEPDEEIPF